MSHLLPLSPDWAVWRVAAVRGAGMPIDWLDALTESGEGVSSLLAKPTFTAALTWQNPEAMNS